MLAVRAMPMAPSAAAKLSSVALHLHDVAVAAAGHQAQKRRFQVRVGEDGKPLCFSRQKSKEILAYLVDRRGGLATVDQIVAALWEDRAGEACVRACYQTAFKNLRKDLERAGVGEILMSNRNQKAIDTGVVECDYYDLLAGDRRALEAFPGQYMADYSWAEPTAAHCVQVKAGHIYG